MPSDGKRLIITFSFLVNSVEKRHDALYKTQTKEESEKLRGEGDQIKSIDIRFE